MRNLAVALLLIFSAMAVGAQGTNGMVSATVWDQREAVVLKGASVTLTNVETRAAQKCLTNEKGECKFHAPAGSYALTADLEKFCLLTISSVQLKENETIPIELKLERPVKVLRIESAGR